MTDKDPNNRPTMEIVVNTFQHIIGALSASKLRARLSMKKETRPGIMVRFFKFVVHAFRTIGYRLQGLAPIPTPYYTVGTFKVGAASRPARSDAAADTDAGLDLVVSYVSHSASRSRSLNF